MKIYFAGAIRGGRQKVEDYKKMVERFQKHGHTVLTKHVADPNLTVEGSKVTDNEIYVRDTKWLEECDLVFADVTVPSLGVGFEIAYAEKINKKIYAVYEKDKDVSRLILGDTNIEFLPYTCIDDLLDKIDMICTQ